MLLYLTLGIAVLTLVIGWIAYRKSSNGATYDERGCLIYDLSAKNYENVYTPMFVIGTVMVIAVFIMGCVAIGNHSALDAQIAEKQQLRSALVYQLDNEVYENDNDYGKKELYNQITEWNTWLAKYQHLQYNFWVGVFTPDIYDQFEYISLP